jgi:hypothetical protein
MWHVRSIPLFALALGALLAGPAAALELKDAGASTTAETPAGTLRFEFGQGVQVPGETAFTPALRDFRQAPAADADRLLYFTPSLTLGGAVLSFGAGYGTTTPFPSGDTTTMRFGGGLEIGSLRLGAIVEQSSGAFLADTGARQSGFDLGASYDIGAFTTGLNWSRGLYRDFVSSGSGNETQDELSLSLSYRISRSIDLIGAVQYDQTDSKTRPDSAGSFLFGTAIRF